MAEQIKRETSTAVATKTANNEVVTYKTSNGIDIKLTPQIVRDVITNGNRFITDNEIALFMTVCSAQKCNPFIREAYLIKFDEKKPASIVTGLGYFEKVADEHPMFDGKRDGIIVQTAKGDIVDRIGCWLSNNEKLIGGWCEVYRKDRKFPTVAKLMEREYNKHQAEWNTKPAVMVNKCAKVAALRGAFPNNFNGCYIEEELKTDDNQGIDETRTYDIPSTENAEYVETQDLSTTDTVILEAEPIEAVNTESSESDICVIPYNEYKNNKDLYERVDYENGDPAYNATDKTMRVRKK